MQSYRRPVYTPSFTEADLNFVLYGRIKSSPFDQSYAGHSVSGLIFSIDAAMAQNVPSLAGKSHGNRQYENFFADISSVRLPEGLGVRWTLIGNVCHVGVFCETTVISKGVRYGPFTGRAVQTSEIKTNSDNSHMWEIFEDGKLSHFVDGRSKSKSWLSYCNCARFAQEQNLIVVQRGSEIFYEVCKDINPGTELLVWYGDTYSQFMGIPENIKEQALSDNFKPPSEEVAKEGYTCDRCGKVFAYKYYRDKHLKYTKCVDQGDRKFPCHLCSRSFEKRDRLRIHILHVHEKYRPHSCCTCGKKFSQSSSLNKHMRIHSGERPYKCVYCSKAFTASSILRTHIRQHSGEKPFKCKICGKSFASHAAHDSHVRRTHTKAPNASSATTDIVKKDNAGLQPPASPFLDVVN